MRRDLFEDKRPYNVDNNILHFFVRRLFRDLESLSSCNLLVDKFALEKRFVQRSSGSLITAEHLLGYGGIHNACTSLQKLSKYTTQINIVAPSIAPFEE